MRKSLYLATVAVLFAATPAIAETDQAFLRFAIQGDVSEAMLGKISAQKGSEPAVRSAGLTIEGDHDKARIEAVKLADLRGMTSPTSPTPEAAMEAKKLEGLSGAAFDKEFASFMVSAHRKTIAQFQAEANSGKGPVARYAMMAIPTLEKHLHMAEALESAKVGQ